MAGKKDVHVVPDGKSWRVEREGQKRAIAVSDTQAEAAKIGRATARKDQVEFNLHGRDGRVRAKDSYGNDPRRIKG